MRKKMLRCNIELQVHATVFNKGFFTTESFSIQSTNLFSVATAAVGNIHLVSLCIRELVHCICDSLSVRTYVLKAREKE